MDGAGVSALQYVGVVSNNKAVVTTTISLQFDYDLTVVRLPITSHMVNQSIQSINQLCTVRLTNVN